MFEFTSSAKKFIVIVMVFILVVCGLCFFLLTFSENAVTEERQHYTEEVTTQITRSIKSQIQTKFEILESVSSNVSTLYSSGVDGILLSYFENVRTKHNFGWLGTVDSNLRMDVAPHEEGVATLFDFSLEGYDQLEKTFENGENVIVETCAGYQGMILSSPLHDKNGEIVRAVVALVHEKALLTSVDLSLLEDQGCLSIMAKDGRFISTHSHGSSEGFKNIFQLLGNAQEIRGHKTIKEIERDVSSGSDIDSNLKVDLGQGLQDALIKTNLLDIGDWSLVAIYFEDSFSQSLKLFSSLSVGLIFVLTITAILFILVVVIHENKRRASLEQFAFVDPVTKGMTELKFILEFEKKQKEKFPWCFVSFDIVKFKLINELYGSEKGDLVLKHVYDGISSNLDKNEFIARGAADKFVMVLNDSDHDEIYSRIEAFTHAVNAFNDTLEEPYFLMLNFGVAVLDEPASLVNIRDKANMARKEIKTKEHSDIFEISFYDIDYAKKLQEEQKIANIMEKSLAKGEFKVYFQPYVSLKTREIVGCEALVRWDDPRRGILQPADFIPLFERNGFIVQLDLFIFEQVCKELKSRLGSGKKVCKVSVNMSRVHLTKPYFWVKYEEICKRYEVPPSLITIELTESMFFENNDFLMMVLIRFREFGFTCALDDFGSGYSSLNIIKNIPVDILKIDKSFLSDERDERSNKVIKSVINLAKDLNMEIIAEGVETMQQLEMLSSLGCHAAQGFVFARPMPMDAFESEYLD